MLIPNAGNKDRTSAFWLRNLDLGFYENESMAHVCAHHNMRLYSSVCMVRCVYVYTHTNNMRL
jgi:hypothetical protein